MAGRRRLPWWPMALAAALIVASCALGFVVIQGLNTDAMLPEAIIGYVLTPFGATGALILARSLDLRLQGNPAYLRLDGQRRIRMVGVLVGVSFLPALIHIWYIAGYMGSLWS